MPSVIGRFSEAVLAGDIYRISDLLAADVCLHGTRFTPFEGKEAVLAVFAMLHEVIDNLEYLAEYQAPEGVVIQVRGQIAGRDFDGAQILRFNAEGLIEECRDLMRPQSAATALLEEGAKYFARMSEGTDP